jgi:D-glycero-D-manno-heptose 1,7-bisphosphate phosphatase
MTADDLTRVHDRMLCDVRNAGGDITAIYHCPHDWNEGCRCRKPKPGMLLEAQRDHDLDLTRTFFIGDDKRDAEAAIAAGCRPALVDAGATFHDLTASLLAGTLEETLL